MKTCPQCGDDFSARRPQAIYCSTQCSNAFRKRLERDRASRIRTIEAPHEFFDGPDGEGDPEIRAILQADELRYRSMYPGHGGSSKQRAAKSKRVRVDRRQATYDQILGED